MTLKSDDIGGKDEDVFWTGISLGREMVLCVHWPFSFSHGSARSVGSRETGGQPKQPWSGGWAKGQKEGAVLTHKMGCRKLAP